MLKAKDGDFFISDWLRNRDTVEFLGIWERIYNPDFNYGEYAAIRNQAGLNNYKISVKEWAAKKQKLELTWVGKDERVKLEPRVLVEEPKKSYGNPKSENMLIFGDNLLSLKALEQDFAEKIKCIYIDI